MRKTRKQIVSVMTIEKATAPTLVTLDVPKVRMPKALKALGVTRLRTDETGVVGVFIPAGRVRSDFGPGWRTAGRSEPSLLRPCSDVTCALLAAIKIPKETEPDVATEGAR